MTFWRPDQGDTSQSVCAAPQDLNAQPMGKQLGSKKSWTLRKLAKDLPKWSLEKFTSPTECRTPSLSGVHKEIPFLLHKASVLISSWHGVIHLSHLRKWLKGVVPSGLKQKFHQNTSGSGWMDLFPIAKRGFRWISFTRSALCNTPSSASHLPLGSPNIPPDEAGRVIVRLRILKKRIAKIRCCQKTVLLP